MGKTFKDRKEFKKKVKQKETNEKDKKSSRFDWRRAVSDEDSIDLDDVIDVNDNQLNEGDSNA